MAKNKTVRNERISLQETPSKNFGLYYNAITNKFNTVMLGRVEHSTMALTGTILQAIRR